MLTKTGRFLLSLTLLLFAVAVHAQVPTASISCPATAFVGEPVICDGSGSTGVNGKVGWSTTGFADGTAAVAGSISFAPARKEMAYVSGQKVVVRNTATLDVTKEINSATGMSFGEDAIYTLDGKFLVVLATNTIFDKPDTKRFIYFYDTTSYQLARQLDITYWSPPVVNNEVALNSNVVGTAVAVAPDSRTMAVAYTKDQSGKQQAQVVLRSGER
jgi:hypothetical protein